MNVLSLFDGMSCGQIALNRAGIKYKKYYASEIKKHAIKCTMNNYLDTIQVGNVRLLEKDNFPKINLLIGGSPCQDFSRMNKNRDGLNGEKSSLFYEYLRILNEFNPDYFLLENVVMEKEQESIINDLLDIHPVRINASRVSPVHRDRLYWTNIKYYTDLFGNKYTDIPRPNIKNIQMNDILTSGYSDRIKGVCITTKNNVLLNNIKYTKKRNENTGMINVIFESNDYDYEKGIRPLNQTELERCHGIPQGYCNGLSYNQTHDLIGDGWHIDIVAHIFSFLDK
jgi:DNA (cytosine-5)-methyltransferase 3A